MINTSCSPSSKIILAIETSTTVCSIAIYSSNEIIAEIDLYKKNSHAEVITSCITHLLTSSKLEMKDLSAIAISSGPGSYTGLRIGTSIAKGICFSLNIPLIAITTLESMIFYMQRFNFQKSLLCPMIDARRMEVYTTIMDYKNDTILPLCAMIVNEESFKDLLKDNEIIFFGDGSQKCANLLKKNKNSRFLNDIHPNARSIAEMAYKKLLKNEVADLTNFSPIYLKEFDSILTS